MSPPRRILAEEVTLLLLLLVVWVGRVVYAHGLPGGVTVEWLLFGGLLVPAHLARLLAWRGLGSPPRIGLACELLALGAFAVGWTAPALGCGLLSALCLATQPGGDAAPSRGAAALSSVALVALVACLAMAWTWERPMAGTRILLALPLLGEAARGPRGVHAHLRRVAAAVVVAVFALCRLEVVFGLAAGVWTAGAALNAWGGGGRRSAFRWLAPACMLLLVYALGEVAVRVLPAASTGAAPAVPPPERIHAPSTSTTWTPPAAAVESKPVVVKWNGHGRHDTEHAVAKAPSTLRIVVLGDSFVEGQQVALSELYHLRLSSALEARIAPPVEAIAFGWSGWGQAEELAKLKQEGLSYAPDVVLVEFLPANDVRDNDARLKQAAERELVRSSWARPLQLDAARKDLRLLELLARRGDQALRRLRGGTQWLDTHVYEEHPTRLAQAWSEAWERTEELLAELDATARGGGARLGVVVFPSHHEVESKVLGVGGYDYPARRVQAFCRSRGIACFDLTPRFAASGDAEHRQSLFWKGDGHWTKGGHDLAAQATAEWLAGEGGLLAEHAKR
jgi:hypothetical protein